MKLNKMEESQICDISDELRKDLENFRYQKAASNSALILKVDREKKLVVLDERLDNVTVEELQEILPSHQPRYIIYAYKMIHEDQRVSYPLCFIYYTPRDSQIELQLLYAYTRSALQREVDLSRVFEIRELDELTEDWLKNKLK